MQARCESRCRHCTYWSYLVNLPNVHRLLLLQTGVTCEDERNKYWRTAGEIIDPWSPACQRDQAGDRNLKISSPALEINRWAVHTADHSWYRSHVGFQFIRINMFVFTWAGHSSLLLPSVRFRKARSTRCANFCFKKGIDKHSAFLNNGSLYLRCKPFVNNYWK